MSFIHILLFYKYRVGPTSAGTSVTRAAIGMPSHLEVWNLKATLSKGYEDIKVDSNDVITLLNFYD